MKRTAVPAAYLPFMPSDLFSAAGLIRWRRHLNESDLFRREAATWSGRLLLVEDDGATAERLSWLVVEGGQCTEARPAEAEDEGEADFVLSAAPVVWEDLVAGRTTPAMAAMVGRLSLRKGSVLALVPHARAAAALLAAASEGES